MKSPFLFLFLFACCSVASAAEAQGKVTSYGVFRLSGKEEVVKSPDTPTGVTRIAADTPVLIAPTNHIPAKMGVLFGMWYEITNVAAPDGDISVTKVARHPPLKKPDGTTSTGFKFVEKQSVKDGRVNAWTGYGFDYDYELVAGDWEIEMQLNGKTVCKQKFIVFKP